MKDLQGRLLAWLLAVSHSWSPEKLCLSFFFVFLISLFWPYYDRPFGNYYFCYFYPRVLEQKLWMFEMFYLIFLETIFVFTIFFKKHIYKMGFFGLTN